MLSILGAIAGFVWANLTSGHFYIGVAVGALVGVGGFRAIAARAEKAAAGAGVRV